MNEDISVVLDEIEAGKREPIPDHDLLVGGFPCQDYSVAKALARSVEGEKGVLCGLSTESFRDKSPPPFYWRTCIACWCHLPRQGTTAVILKRPLLDLGYG